ncbi:hypothetical protein NKI51_18890, partial [Mesorhizobium australicum]|uniref:hypothetical protein n=1 Tax=Mesorhizobium australicum TaxID=536018 RepID=UPI00333C4546
NTPTIGPPSLHAETYQPKLFGAPNALLCAVGAIAGFALAPPFFGLNKVLASMGFDKDCSGFLAILSRAAH